MIGLQRVRELRSGLGLSRSELARFLGVSEATVVRWETSDGMTEPKGLQAVLLRALHQAERESTSLEVARIVRSCGLDHARAVHMLLELARTRAPESSRDARVA